MNRNTILNFVLFLLLAAAVGGTWWYVESTFFQKPVPTPEPAKPSRETVLALAGGVVTATEPASGWASRYVPPAPPKAEKPVEPPKPADPPKPSAPTEPYRLVALGGEGFNKRVLLTSRGGAVQQVVLPAFDHASRLGVDAKDAAGNTYPLELVPGYYQERDNTSVKSNGERRVLTPTEPGKTIDPAVAQNLSEPSYALLHYPMPGDPLRQPDDKDKLNERFPSPELVARTWKVVEEVPGTDEADAKVVFETTLAAPYHIRIRKTFQLGKRDYHVRMKLEFVGEKERPEAKTRVPLKYQIVGGLGLPVEGEWYTGTYRNAQVGWRTPNGTHKRDIQDSSTITTQHGGNTVEPQGNTFTYAAVSTQYFATALAVDPDAPDEWKKDPWAYVRATRERSPGVPEDKPQLWDVTVRAVSRPVDPAPGQTVAHAYWIYNGPIKVRLLKQLDLLEKDKREYTTDAGTVDRYLTDVGLNTLTDAPTPNWFGAVASAIYWTDLVVFFTNLMHGVLGWLHRLVPVWGVNILILTVLVRLMLMVPSRRQQASMLKMQEKMTAMKPELDKLTERLKNDPQRLNQEKTRLMLQHGVNPLSSMGGCLLMFAQMPVFMGLYFCLQESVFFRLDRFLWMQNLAAPDMLFSWSESIPFISSAADLGGTFYMGPFVNVLPVVAVALMYINMLVSTPPPTDEQQEMNQKMMKYMMIFMGFFFYKMAAGMCVYFIVSTLWGLTERKLLKKKAGQTPPPPLVPPAPLAAETAKAVGTPATGAGGGLMGRFRQRLVEKMEEMQQQAETSRQIVNDPKPGQPPQPGPNGKGPGGKKKRKKK